MMKATLSLVLATLALWLSALPAHAAQMDTPATHAILLDAGTGTLLLEKGADEHMPTSSMSKTMTMYMVFEALKAGRIHLDDEFQVSEKAWRMQGSKMFIKVGDKVKVEDLIRGVLIQSGNDSAVALAEGLSGSEDAFVEAMNTRMKDIGMADSHFMNASGWPADGHYSTPRDLATLALRIMTDFPEYYHYFSEKEFTYNKIHQQNRDPLLSHLPGADGLKTGHTDIAGFGLIGSAKRGDRRLILVMNGLGSQEQREQEGVRLMEWGFRNFENKTLVKKGETLATARVWLGNADEVPLVAKEDVTVVLPVARRADTKITVTYDGPLKAPVKKDAAVAKLKIEVPDQQPLVTDLIAGADDARAGAFARAKSRLSYLLTGSY
jgi:D-alanyl-D-alanine carboxypeptidase (penicillin-binding protein 5/6)